MNPLNIDEYWENKKIYFTLPFLAKLHLVLQNSHLEIVSHQTGDKSLSEGENRS